MTSRLVLHPHAQDFTDVANDVTADPIDGLVDFDPRTPCDRSPNGAHHLVYADDEFGEWHDVNPFWCTWCDIVGEEIRYRNPSDISHYGAWSWQWAGLAGRPWIVSHQGRIIW